jgi:hypothetical protein
LERYCCRQHSENRSTAKERARDAVLITQYRAQQEALKDFAIMAERIAAAYMTECREARIFARRLGMADEIVALENRTDNKCMMESMLVRRRASTKTAEQQQQQLLLLQRRAGLSWPELRR